MAVKEIRNSYLEPMQNYYKSNSKTDRSQKPDSDTAVQNDKIVYEKTIPDSVMSGLDCIQSMEKQVSGSKFFIHSVHEMDYENLSDINFEVNPEFLSKIGKDETLRKQFEEDIEYLSEFTKRFREQQLSKGNEIVNQIWICDENGNWGALSIMRTAKQSSILQHITDEAIKILKEKTEEELKVHLGDRFKGLKIKWLEEKYKAKETEKVEEKNKLSEKENSKESRRVGVNAAKLSAKIAAAKTAAQLQAVMADIASDMQQVKEGLSNGWCSQAEVDKVKALMAMAQNKMGQVDNRKATPEEESAFTMASLM